ncbi:MAG: RadC family protein [Allosphingosinicella sp.]
MERTSPELRDAEPFGGRLPADVEACLLDLALHRPAPVAPVTTSPGAPKPATDGEGHRDRLRQRLFDGGPDALLDHELVEYLLSLVVRRRDTKALAKRLIKEFGGFGRLLCADVHAIKRVGGLSDGTVAALKIAQATALRLLKEKVRDRPVLGSWQALLDYLRADMAHEAIERVRVLFLDAKNRLIRDEPMWEGSVDESAVYIREIMKRALDCHATAIIIVHNHPSGDPSPSQQDIRLTRDLAEAGRHLRVTLHDHVIIGANGHSSLRAMGVI